MGTRLPLFLEVSWEGLAASLAFFPVLNKRPLRALLVFNLPQKLAFPVWGLIELRQQLFAWPECPSCWTPAASLSGSGLGGQERKAKPLGRSQPGLTFALVDGCLVFFRGFCGWRPSTPPRPAPGCSPLLAASLLGGFLEFSTQPWARVPSTVAPGGVSGTSTQAPLRRVHVCRKHGCVLFLSSPRKAGPSRCLPLPEARPQHTTAHGGLEIKERTSPHPGSLGWGKRTWVEPC